MKERIFGGVIATTFLFLWASFGLAAEINILPILDTSIYEGSTTDLTEDPGGDGSFEDNSCGIGDVMFSGMSNRDFIRRALVKFDIANSLPPGSTISSVTLTLNIDRSGDDVDAPMTLHAVTPPAAGNDWDEGTTDCVANRGGGRGIQATTGDATWLDRYFDTVSWSTVGGDFNSTPSATATVGTTGTGVWSSAGMVNDVQNWLDPLNTNSGWIVVGDETRFPTTRRFQTREGRNPPVLNIVFDCPGCGQCCFTNGDCLLELTETDCLDKGGVSFDAGITSCEPNLCPQPTGACCNLDESCSENVDRLVCENAGGSFQGEGSSCSTGLCGLEPFVDPLPIPAVVQPVSVIGGVPQYEITMSEVRQELHSQLPDTDVWVYNGSYPGPTIEAREGEPISVKYINDLPSLHYLNVDECPHGPNYWQNSTRTVVHLHGGHVPAGVDGHPEQTIMPGEFDVFDYPNTQISTTLWYHDHALGITRLNVQMGLAAFYIIRGDDEDALGLPSGTNEIPLVIQDREFNDDGTFFYPPVLQTTFFGDKILVNGKVWPFLNVKRGKYRFRVLNGSNSRVYTLSLSNGAQFQLIGTDGGLITSPRTLSDVTIAPAERADIVIDFAGYAPGTEIILKNSARAPFPNGSPNVPPNVMKFIVTTEAGHTGVIPGLLRTVDPILDAVAETRYFNLIRVTPTENPPEICGGGEWLIESHDAPPTDPQSNVIGSHWDDISEFPELGTTEIWEFYNSTNIMHPMHVHLVMFQVLDRTDLNTAQSLPLSEYERDAWKDTVMALPQTRTRIIARYEDYSGKFPFHCHILEHEDHEMMRQFQATFPPCVPNGICEPGEDCLSCSDCAVVSGALCGNGLCEIGDGEDCVSCPEDCAGRDKGNSQYCCGGDDPQTGVDCSDARCTDGFFCRDSARLQACCGDTLCEGEETNANCSVDCDVICVPEGNREKGNDCNDGIDNDCDGFTDGADTDCGGTGCTPTTVSCTDGVDNDCDGLIDCADSDGDEDCSTDPACTCVITEDPEVTTCFDGLDNDCDTSIDCADSSCDGAVNGTCDTGQQGICGPGTFQCQGGAQQCVADTPPQTEGPPADPTCSDGDDNDCDGLTDGNDPDCGVCVPTTDNEKGGKKCRDGIDNDCDGLIDGADPGCQ